MNHNRKTYLGAEDLPHLEQLKTYLRQRFKQELSKKCVFISDEGLKELDSAINQTQNWVTEHTLPQENHCFSQAEVPENVKSLLGLETLSEDQEDTVNEWVTDEVQRRCGISSNDFNIGVYLRKDSTAACITEAIVDVDEEYRESQKWHVDAPVLGVVKDSGLNSYRQFIVVFTSSPLMMTEFIDGPLSFFLPPSTLGDGDPVLREISEDLTIAFYAKAANQNSIATGRLKPWTLTEMPGRRIHRAPQLAGSRVVVAVQAFKKSNP
eukprot:m.207772 g.207772  ORF g.207772 m.207772 type:complete len:266 (+) comp32994_c1_seq2:131-928(+)